MYEEGKQTNRFTNPIGSSVGLSIYPKVAGKKSALASVTFRRFVVAKKKSRGNYDFATFDMEVQCAVLIQATQRLCATQTGPLFFVCLFASLLLFRFYCAPAQYKSYSTDDTFGSANYIDINSRMKHFADLGDLLV